MRKLIVSISCLLLVVLLSVNTFAAGSSGVPHNYLEYQTDYYLSGDNIFSEYDLPLLGCTVEYSKNNGSGWNSQYINNTWYTFDGSSGLKSGDYIKWIFFPLGYFTDKNEYNLNHCISLDGLPSGTTIAFRVAGEGGYSWVEPISWDYLYWIQYYDADGKSISGSQKVTPTFDGQYYVGSIDISPPSDAVAFRVYFQVQCRLSAISGDWWVTEGIKDFRFRLVLDKSTYDYNLDQYQNQKVTDSIDGIGDKVDSTNDKLDGIRDDLDESFNRPVEPETPPGSDSVDRLDQIEDSLLTDADSLLDSYDELMSQGGLVLTDYLPALRAVSRLIDDILLIPVFNVLTIIALLLGLSGTVLGITNLLTKRSKGG